MFDAVHQKLGNFTNPITVLLGMKILAQVARLLTGIKYYQIIVYSFVQDAL